MAARRSSLELSGIGDEGGAGRGPGVLPGGDMPITRNFPLEISEYNATTKCRECEVFIGIGHHDATPMPSYDGEGFLCRACVRAQSRRRQPGWRAVIWTD